MTLLHLFAALLALVSGFACWRGGAPERIAGLLLIVAWVATVTLTSRAHSVYVSVDGGYIAIDVALLIGLSTIALLADRYWPTWLAALQLIAVATHGVKAYRPELLPIAYFWMATKISYPIVGILAAGTVRHVRRRRDGYPEFAWTFQRWRVDERGIPA